MILSFYEHSEYWYQINKFFQKSFDAGGAIFDLCCVLLVWCTEGCRLQSSVWFSKGFASFHFAVHITWHIYIVVRHIWNADRRSVFDQRLREGSYTASVYSHDYNNHTSFYFKEYNLVAIFCTDAWRSVYNQKYSHHSSGYRYRSPPASN